MLFSDHEIATLDKLLTGGAIGMAAGVLRGKVAAILED